MRPTLRVPFPIALTIALTAALTLVSGPAGGQPDHAPPLQQSTALLADADATINSYAPSSNYGGALNALEAEHTSLLTLAFLVRFDLSSLPVMAIPDSAMMELYLTNVYGPATVNLPAYRLQGAWDEYTVNAYTPINPIFAQSSSASIGTQNAYYMWNVLSYLEAWRSGAANYGMFVWEPNGDYGRYFENRHSTETGGIRPPMLAVTYHYPRFEGYVRDSASGDAAIPGVTVSLYCSNNQPDVGTFLGTVATDAGGWFGLETGEVCEYYNIVETNLPGLRVGQRLVYRRDGASIPTGSSIAYPLTGKNLTDNYFRDHRRPPPPAPARTPRRRRPVGRRPRRRTRPPVPALRHAHPPALQPQRPPACLMTPTPSRDARGPGHRGHLPRGRQLCGRGVPCHQLWRQCGDLDGLRPRAGRGQPGAARPAALRPVRFIPPGSTVYAARLDALYLTGSGGDGPEELIEVAVHRVPGPPGARTRVTWANQPAVEPDALALAPIPAGAVMSLFSWDVLPLVQDWVNGAVRATTGC